MNPNSREHFNISAPTPAVRFSRPRARDDVTLRAQSRVVFLVNHSPKKHRTRRSNFGIPLF